MGTYQTVRQFAKMLGNLDQWLQAAAAHAQNKNFDPEVLVQARLAPDQYALVQQIQSACDSAKYAAAYLSGQKAPAHPDAEKTLSELHTRIGTCLAYLDTFKASDFGDPAGQRVAPPWMAGKSVRGDRYLTELSIPNFYFHVTTAYAILRHNGVPLGKSDFVGVKDFSEFADE